MSADLPVHIFSVSAAMVGVCLTVIQLFKLAPSATVAGGIGDDLVALDAGVFLVSCFLAYVALRSRGRQRRDRIERFADRIFLIGLLLMAVICALVAYEFV